MRHLKELALLVFIAAFYFGSVYFAVAALFTASTTNPLLPTSPNPAHSLRLQQQVTLR